MNHNRHILPVAALPALALTALLSGCAAVGYNLGSMLPPEIQTVHVPNVVNQTNEPLIETEITRAVLDEIQRDGSLKLASPDLADALLEIAVTHYDIVPLAFDSDRLTAAEEYRIFLTAGFRLTNLKTGEILAQSTGVRGDATFEFAGDLTSSKARGLPLAATDLANDIVQGVVEYW